jgi:hypothetical protein
MTTQAGHEELLPLILTSHVQEWIPDLLPRPDGIRFVRGALLAIALCLPIWVLGWWVLASRI